ncbi:MAG: 50S ribosomal protein L10 [Chloroflexota bacterium]
MPSSKKVQEVEELKEKLSRSTVAIATGFSGTHGSTMTELRRHLRSQGIEYRVVKNTLMERAAEAAGHPEVKEVLEGPTGLVFGYGDPIQQVKVLVDYIRSNRLPVAVRAAVLEGRVYRDQQLTALMTIPSREVLAGQLVGQLAGPLVRLVTALNAPVRGLASVLQQRVAQLGGA